MPRRLRLSSSAMLQRSMAMNQSSIDTDYEVNRDPHGSSTSDDDFVEPNPFPARGRGRSRGASSGAGATSGASARDQDQGTSGSSGFRELASASDRVHNAVQRGLSVLNRNRRRSSDTVSGELSDRFPFLSRGTGRQGQGRSKKKVRISTWKTVPCCFSSPSTVRVPTKAVLDTLCRDGLGTLWFVKDQEPLELEYLSAMELHFFLTCLYPSIRNAPYELCRAGGPGHQVLVPIPIDDPDKVPHAGRPFVPFFTVEMLKTSIGRKGRLYIRPLQEIQGAPRVSQIEVSLNMV